MARGWKSSSECRLQPCFLSTYSPRPQSNYNQRWCTDKSLALSNSTSPSWLLACLRVPLFLDISSPNLESSPTSNPEFRLRKTTNQNPYIQNPSPQRPISRRDQLETRLVGGTTGRSKVLSPAQEMARLLTLPSTSNNLAFSTVVTSRSSATKQARLH